MPGPKARAATGANPDPPAPPGRKALPALQDLREQVGVRADSPVPPDRRVLPDRRGPWVRKAPRAPRATGANLVPPAQQDLQDPPAAERAAVVLPARLARKGRKDRRVLPGIPDPRVLLAPKAPSAPPDLLALPDPPDLPDPRDRKDLQDLLEPAAAAVDRPVQPVLWGRKDRLESLGLPVPSALTARKAPRDLQDRRDSAASGGRTAFRGRRDLLDLRGPRDLLGLAVRAWGLGRAWIG